MNPWTWYVDWIIRPFAFFWMVILVCRAIWFLIRVSDSYSKQLRDERQARIDVTTRKD